MQYSTQCSGAHPPGVNASSTPNQPKSPPSNKRATHSWSAQIRCRNRQKSRIPREKQVEASAMMQCPLSTHCCTAAPALARHARLFASCTAHCSVPWPRIAAVRHHPAPAPPSPLPSARRPGPGPRSAKRRRVPACVAHCRPCSEPCSAHTRGGTRPLDARPRQRDVKALAGTPLKFCSPASAWLRLTRRGWWCALWRTCGDRVPSSALQPARSCSRM